MKTILIAPQTFKESLSGLEVAIAMEKGVKRVWPTCKTILLPVADGGDGTLVTLVQSSKGTINRTKVQDPLGRDIIAEWGALGDKQTAVIEMSKASGLSLLNKNERNPYITTTYGTGQLIRSVLDQGFSKIIVGIGGSATNDGGAGMAEALGAKFLDDEGKQIDKGGFALNELDQIDVSAFCTGIKKVSVEVACDVTNPMIGQNGASTVFGPQKGADMGMVEQLDLALTNYSNVLTKTFGKDFSHIPGSGAAGGLGGGLLAFLNAKLRKGADIVLDALNLDKHLAQADMVIVGEGQIDRSTIFNKAPIAVALRASKLNVPVIGIAGSLGSGFKEVHFHGINAVFSVVNGPMSLETSLSNTSQLVTSATEQACRATNILGS